MRPARLTITGSFPALRWRHDRLDSARVGAVWPAMRHRKTAQAPRRRFMQMAGLLVVLCGVAREPANLWAHERHAADDTAVLRVAMVSALKVLGEQLSWVRGTIALEPRLPCVRASGCPRGWIGTRAEATTGELAKEFRLIVGTVAAVYTESQFLGADQRPEFAAVTGVIALGQPEGSGKRLIVPVGLWWHTDAERMAVIQKKVLLTLEERSTGWAVTEVVHVQTLETRRQ